MVDLHDVHYGNLATDPPVEVRQDPCGGDLGPAGLQRILTAVHTLVGQRLSRFRLLVAKPPSGATP